MTKKKNVGVDIQGLNTLWKLGNSKISFALTEVEWSVMRFHNAFERSCMQIASISGCSNLNFQELVLLHVVAMQHHPQNATSLARQLNRDDVANLQYTLRKLLSEDLISKQKEERSKAINFSITETGLEVVANYAKLRDQLLTSRVGHIESIDNKLEEMSSLLSLLTGIYEDASRASATYYRGEPS